MMEKGNVFEILSQSIADIDYVKKDATTRKIRATLNDEIVPAVENPKTLPDTHITVFDIEKDQWRTLIIENIQKLTTLVRS
jgi:hypothetical protein